MLICVGLVGHKRIICCMRPIRKMGMPVRMGGEREDEGNPRVY